MAKITALPLADEVSGNEQFPMVQLGQTVRGGVQPVVQKLAIPYVDMAAVQADRSEAAALGQMLYNQDYIYESLEELEDDTDVPADGSSGGFVATEDGEAMLAEKGPAGATVRTHFATRATLRHHGINLWEVVGKARLGSDVESDWVETSEAIKQAMWDAKAWGVGRVNCGGRDKVYVCGGPYENFGTFNLREKGQADQTLPFPRGRIPLVSGVELVGNSRASRAKFLAAPGDHNPGGLFYAKFWEDLEGGNISDVGFRWLDIDGNEANQSYSAYAAKTPDGRMWIHGHAISGGAVQRLMAYECRIHGWWGHAIFGWSDLDTGKLSNDWAVIGCDVFNNMQGGAQIAMSRFYSERNRWHGNGGWTALGPNIEVHSEAEEFYDIVSINDIFDGRDGLSTTIATTNWADTLGDFTGYDTDSPEAAAAQRHFRRGFVTSGNWYGRPEGDVFARQRGRVSVIHPKLWQSSIVITGTDRVVIDSPIIESSYEDVSKHWPMVPEAIRVTPADGGLAVTGFDQVAVRGAMINRDMEGPGILITGFAKADISGQITGGRDAGVRMEACGGRVAVDVENVGTIVEGAPEHSCAVAVFGQRGPLLVDVQAIESRPVPVPPKEGEEPQPDLRTMTHAVYVNTGVGFPVRVSGSATGMLEGKWVNVGNNAIDAGLIDQAERRLETNIPMLAGGGLESLGSPTFRSEAGEINVNLVAPGDRKINFLNEDGLQAQIHQLANGDLQFNTHNNGVGVGTPLVIANDGHLVANIGMATPLEIRPVVGGGTIAWLWSADDGVLRISPTRPTSEELGVAVGDQTDGV